MATGKAVRLVVMGEETSIFAVLKEAVLLGRDPSNDVVLNSSTISRHHARLFKTAEGWSIKDLGSRNGVYLRGAKVQEAHVELGGEFRMGGFALRLEETPEGADGGLDETQTFTVVPRVAQARRATSGTDTGVLGLLNDLVSKDDEEDLDRRLVKALREFFAAEGVFLFAVPKDRPASASACCQYEASSEGSGATVLSQSTLQKALKEKSPIWAPLDMGRSIGSLSGLSGAQILIYPLLRDGRVRGLLYLDWGSPRENPVEQMNLLSPWPAWATSALEAVWERRALRVRVEEDSRQQEHLSQAFRRQIDPGAILGDAPALREAMRAAAAAAPSPYPILLVGETGAGKEIFARWIHLHSPREGGAFVALNCAGIPAATAESELFGHRRGAFTGADRDHAGLFEQAEGGTLFLDEIGDMTLALQAKVLRAVQFGVVRRVGDDRERKVDVRLLAATHRDLRLAISERQFREDLYYRLTTFEICLPPLRQRAADIPVLAVHFLERAYKKPGTAQGFSPGALRTLKDFDWPGNVRQLQSAVNHLSASATGPVIEEADVRRLLGTSGRPGPLPGDDLAALPYKEALRGFEESYLRGLLERAGGNVSEAARQSGLPRRTFYRFLERHPHLKDS